MTQNSASVRAPAESLVTCVAILEELGRIEGLLHEESARRDTPYLAERRLGLMREYCQWLTRRVSAEFLLVLRVQLERELRSMISPEAYQLFQRLEDIEDTAREIEATPDEELMARQREGSLFREVLDQVRLRDVVRLPLRESGREPSRE
jgi:hypothetical protein